jgi:hypothetical protein
MDSKELNMASLNELSKALVTICVRYHHTILSLHEPVGDYVHNLLKNKPAEIYSTLEALIDESTKDDQTRSFYLNYILFQLQLIDGFIDPEEIRTEEDKIFVQIHISSFLTNTQKLLEISQTTGLTINYHNQDIIMYGFGRWMRGGLSTCGIAVEEELMTPFRLSTKTSKKQIDEFVGELLQTHCHNLLAINLQEKLNQVQLELEETKALLEIAQARLRIPEKTATIIKFGHFFPGLFGTYPLLHKGMKLLKGDSTLSEDQENSTLQP